MKCRKLSSTPVGLLTVRQALTIALFLRLVRTAPLDRAWEALADEADEVAVMFLEHAERFRVGHVG